ncbi:MAG TPA: hypothetical protein PKW37_07825 [Salinivirgaceae bacterium]|nr:hypothetical protein [Salinivirgaceae bacterium]
MKTITIITILSIFVIPAITTAQDVTETTKASVADTVVVKDTKKHKVKTKEVEAETSDGTVQQAENVVDTTRFTVGSKEVLILEDRSAKSKDKYEWTESGYKKKRSKFKGHVQSFYMGKSLFATKSLSFSLPDTAKFLELNELASIEYGSHLFQISVPLIPRHLGVVSGLGVKWSSFVFENSYTKLDNTKPVLDYTLDSAGNWYVSKLNIWTFTLPVMLEFQTRLGGKDFWVAGGAYGSLRGLARNKLKSNEGVKKFVESKDYHINTLQYGLMTYVGYSSYGIYATYSLSRLFKKGEGPEIYPFSIGFMLTFH